DAATVDPLDADVLNSIEPEGPLRSADPANIALKESTIIIPIEVEISALTESINKDLPQEVMRQDDLELEHNATGDIVVTRNGDIKVRGESGALKLDIPLRIKADIEIPPKVSLKIIDRTMRKSINTALTFHISLVPVLDDEWNITATPTIDMTWDEPPKVKLGPFNINITKKIEPRIKDRFPDIIKQIEQRISERAQTRSKVEQAWSRLAQPASVSDNPPLWLVVRPTKLFGSDLVVTEEHLGLSAGLQGRFELVAGSRPAAPKSKPVPNRSPAPATSALKLNMRVDVQFDEANKKLDEQLEGKTLEAAADMFDDPVPVRIEQAEVYPSGKNLVVKVGFIADPEGEAYDVAGWLFLQGVPHIDHKKREVVLKEIKYDTTTNSMLVNTTEWLIHSEVEEKIAERTHFAFGEKLDQRQGEANQRLKGLTLENGGTLTGKLNSVRLGDIILTEEAIVITATIDGEAALNMDKMPPKPAP
ncbi:MAG: DUF4403 family protein, partial [Proteobacteria bacterium]|nr:DUF4403 family protein [Pseudomonadota bacterium]